MSVGTRRYAPSKLCASSAVRSAYAPPASVGRIDGVFTGNVFSLKDDEERPPHASALLIVNERTLDLLQRTRIITRGKSVRMRITCEIWNWHRHIRKNVDTTIQYAHLDMNPKYASSMYDSCMCRCGLSVLSV